MEKIVFIILLMIPGLFFYIMNWAIFIHNKQGKKWVSNIPPLGGLIIGAVFLFTPYKLCALIGFTDPGFWLIVNWLITEFIQKKNNSDYEENNDNQQKP